LSVTFFENWAPGVLHGTKSTLSIVGKNVLLLNSTKHTNRGGLMVFC